MTVVTVAWPTIRSRLRAEGLSMIDPAVAAFVAESERFYPPDAVDLPVSGQRALYDRYAAHFAVLRPADIASEEGALHQDGRAIPLRLYRRGGAPSGRLVLYAHGGGFMLGSLASHDGIVARVAAGTGADVLAIDYRLAPDHPCPAALDDVLAVAEAIAAGGLPWPDLPRAGLGLMGDSAGATLMAAAALRFGRERPGLLAALALVYPMLAADPTEPARTEQAEAPMLTLADIRFYGAVYLAGRAPPPGTFVLDEPGPLPLPPTVLLPAELDPLRDDCTALAARLAGQGTPHLLLPGTGLVHGCLRALDRAPAVAAPFADLCAFLTRHLPVA